MRIRKHLALSSIPTAALSDLRLQQSEAAPQPEQSSDESMAIHSNNYRWVFSENEEKQFRDDEASKGEANKSTNNEIRKTVNISDGVEDFKRCLQPLSSSVQESCCEGGYKVVPLKKRRGSSEMKANEETVSAKMKSKTNNKCGDISQVDNKPGVEKNGINISSSGSGKKSKRGNVIMEGSRCSRVNGRGWRCCQPTLVGYSLCEHHLGKGRLRSMATVRQSIGCSAPQRLPGDGGSKQEQQEPLVRITKKRTKVAVVKARSLSSLLSQI